MCLLVVISPLGIIDHFMVLLLLIAVLKGCEDNMFVIPIPLVLEDARKVFDNMPEWNVVVLWSYMIAGYDLNGKYEEALKMHWKALMMGMRPNDFTFSIVFLICANIIAYDQGKQVHILTIKYGFDSYDFVGIYLVGMSVKYGFASSFVHSFWESCQNSMN